MAYGSSQARGQIGAAATGQPTPQLQQQQHLVQATPATYTEVHGNARSLTHLMGARDQTELPWILVGFINAEPQGELQAVPVS